MKQKDIAIIVAVVIIAGIISVVVSKMIFVTAANRQQQVQVVEPISTTFTQPSTAYFNSSAVNPTQNIQIGGNNNQAPFGNKGNN